MARHLNFEAGTVVVVDRGYEDHAWWRKLTADGVFFVRRLKDSTHYLIVEERATPADARILRDEVGVKSPGMAETGREMNRNIRLE